MRPTQSLRFSLLICVMLFVACGDDEVKDQAPWSFEEKPNIEDPDPQPTPDPEPDPKPDPKPDPQPTPIPSRLLGYWGGGEAFGGCIEHTFFQHFDPQSDAFTFAFLNNNACVQPDERGMFVCQGTYRVDGDVLITTCQSADGTIQQQTTGAVLVYEEMGRQVLTQSAFVRNDTGWTSQFKQETVGPWPGNARETNTHEILLDPLPDMRTLKRGETFPVSVRMSSYVVNEYQDKAVMAAFELTATVTDVTSSGQVRAVLYPPDARYPGDAFRSLIQEASGQSAEDTGYIVRVMPSRLIWEAESPDRLGGAYFYGPSVVPSTWSNLTDPCTDYDYFYMALKPFEQWCSAR